MNLNWLAHLQNLETKISYPSRSQNWQDIFCSSRSIWSLGGNFRKVKFSSKRINKFSWTSFFIYPTHADKAEPLQLLALIMRVEGLLATDCIETWCLGNSKNDESLSQWELIYPTWWCHVHLWSHVPHPQCLGSYFRDAYNEKNRPLMQVNK